MKKSILVLALATLALALHAQEGADKPAAAPQPPSPPGIVDVSAVYPNALGAWAGSLAGRGGLGLHYQRWEGDFGFSLSAWGIYGDPQSLGMSLGSILDYGVIGQGFWKVFDNDFTSWFSTSLSVYILLGHQGYIPYTSVESPAGSGTWVYQEQPYVAGAVGGFGISIEPVLFQHISLPVEVGIGARWPLSMNMMVSGALRYRF